MRTWLVCVTAAAVLVGCTAKEETTTQVTTTEGAFQGIGVYDAGDSWSRIVVAPARDGSRAATLADDDHVIVVANSQTGEVRQCGDLSGYCITLNPWAGTLDATRAAPVALEPLRDEKGRVIGRPVRNLGQPTPARPTTTTETTTAKPPR